jgi:hypothetical protein
MLLWLKIIVPLIFTELLVVTFFRALPNENMFDSSYKISASPLSLDDKNNPLTYCQNVNGSYIKCNDSAVSDFSILREATTPMPVNYVQNNLVTSHRRKRRGYNDKSSVFGLVFVQSVNEIYDAVRRKWRERGRNDIATNSSSLRRSAIL